MNRSIRMASSRSPCVRVIGLRAIGLRAIGLRVVGLLAIGLLVTAASVPAHAATESVEQLLQQYQAAGAGSFSAERGQTLWSTAVKGRSCSHCHTQDPTAQGQHQKTKKPILALAPSVNDKRLEKTKTIQKWLKRNCKWTLGRECSAQEKGDFLTWLSQQ